MAACLVNDLLLAREVEQRHMPAELTSATAVLVWELLNV